MKKASQGIGCIHSAPTRGCWVCERDFPELVSSMSVPAEPVAGETKCVCGHPASDHDKEGWCGVVASSKWNVVSMANELEYCACDKFSPTPAVAAPAEGKPEWACPRCAYVNSPNCIRCLKCLRYKDEVCEPASTPPPADLDGKLRELLQPLKDACDRSWEDETPEQIVSIAASAIYWRDQEIENLRHNAAPRRAGVFDEADLAKAAALGRVEGLKAAELACLEYRCVRGTPWDLAVLACVEAIRALKVNQ